ncbi:MAG TPA: tetratricopeptide repeat protein [Chitinophagales bacterium]|nr:tetratricopeptide repeat protein [Chitinophagales bacterium]
MKRKIAVAILFSALVFFLSYCHQSSQKKTVPETHEYKNLSDTARYVGMQTCRTCHANVYATFIHTGMGESWDHARKEKSSAKFDTHAYVYDTFKNFWYHPFWKDDSLYIKEFRLEGTDTVYRRTEKISYIVGSGQHTNSHIWMENGFLYQAPLTFYTQKQIWDLPPGFDDGMNTRWNRTVSAECMNCHNMYPQFDAASENKFLSVKTGIECERCHGPGSIHVQEKMAGIIVETSKEIDYSIVNPKKLPRELQVELCQRCHLQGISVLNEGKTFFDFKPGMKLSEVENVFMPRYEGNPNRFIMASHADRMKQSKCYQNSDMTCLTCHNPHVSVTVTPPSTFNNACKSCHGGEHENDSLTKRTTFSKVENFGKGASTDCKLPMAERMKEDDNCYKCHMPVSETLDIPHVTVHDHRIHIPREPPSGFATADGVSTADRVLLDPDKQNAIMKFVKLECMTTKTPGDLLMAQGYLQTYEAYSQKSFLLDSAKKYLSRIPDQNDHDVMKARIRFFFLQNNYAAVTQLAVNIKPSMETDGWTLYRVGESYYQSGDFANAYNYFAGASAIDSLNLEFLNKKGSAAMALGDMNVALQCFRRCVDENPKFAPAVNNLGYVYFLRKDSAYANSLFNKALALDPDYEQALMNKAALFLSQQNIEGARKYLQRVLSINPQNEKAKIAIQHFPVDDHQ